MTSPTDPQQNLPIVSAVNVVKTYGSIRALDNVSLDVESGTVTCVIGPSGSGKSTFLRCINQLETPDGGAIRVNGELAGHRVVGGCLHPLTSREIARQRSRIGMVFQRFNLFPHMTVLQNVTEGPRQVLGHPGRQCRETAARVLEQVGLSHKLDAYPNELSGGQQQRVAIARALAMDPAVMLFDEPTSALDPELVGEVLKVMKDLAMSGTTMIVVTHELAFANDVADSVAFMAEGRLVEIGSADQILTDPKEERTRAFISAVR